MCNCMYQEELRRKAPGVQSERGGASGRGGLRRSGGGERRAGECWLFRSVGTCRFGDDCRFEHDRGQDHGPPPQQSSSHAERRTQHQEQTNTEY